MNNVKNLLILGATSAIAKAYAREVIKESCVNFLLVARNQEKVDELTKDLLARGANSVKEYILDFSNIDSFSHFVDYLNREFKDLNEVLLAYASLPNNEELLLNTGKLESELKLNIMSPLILLTEIANILKAKKSGTIIGISSVAGDRGRKSNFIYGTTKSALTTYLAGLRNYLFEDNVSVITVKPGFVDTPMTENIEKSKLFVKPNIIASGMLSAVKKNKDVVYLPSFWFLIMFIIKAIPEKLFKRLSL